MTIAGDYIGRVRLGVTIGVAGSQSFVWPDGIPAGTYTADAGADGLITLTATVDGDTLTVAWAAADSRRMIGHPWRVLRDGTWLFGDLYVTEAEPSDDDPTEYTVLDGAVEVTVAMVTPSGSVDITGLAELDAANLFTAMQSIGVDLPVTALADAGTVKPTTLVHLHDDEGPRVDLWASSIDFGGGVIVSSAGRLTRRIGFDGEPTDVYLLESYAFVGVSEITSQPLYRLVMAEVESSDPGELPWLSDLLDVTLAPMRVGDPTELDDAATKRYVDATVVATGPTPPDEPTESATAVWNRTPGNLRAFVDFRQFPDGPVDGVDANGAGGSIAPPPVVRSFTELFPLFGGVPATATDGVVRSSGEPADGGDPTSRTGFTFDGVAPGTDGRGEWGFAGYTETDATFVTYVPTNLGISAPYDDLPDGAAGPDAYLGGFVVGRFVGDTDATNPSQPVSWRCKVIRDDLGAPTTIGSAALPRTPVRGDRVAFTWTAAGRFGVEFNGEEIVTATDTTHDLSEFTAIGMVMHQGSDGDHAWEDAYYCGVEWFGISGGDQITGDLGPHRWTDTAGWQPIGPGARPALNAIASGGGAVSSVNGETGVVTLSAADVGAPTLAALGNLSGVDPTKLAEARGNLGLGGLATLSAVAGAEIATGAVAASNLAAAVQLAIGTPVDAATDLTRTTTSLADDTALTFTGTSGTRYWIDAFVALSGDGTADAKVGIVIPGGTMCVMAEHPAANISTFPTTQQMTVLTASAATAQVGVLTGSTTVCRLSGWVDLTSTGTVCVHWAQNGAGAGTGVTRLAKSRITYRS